jgi:hypothetical protein
MGDDSTSGMTRKGNGRRMSQQRKGKMSPMYSAQDIRERRRFKVGME